MTGVDKICLSIVRSLGKAVTIEMAEKSLTTERLLVINGVDALCAGSAVRSYGSDPVSKHTIPKVSEAGTRTIPRGKKSHSKRFFVISQLFSILNSASCEVQRSYLSAKNRPRF